ncbi:MAG: ABC transporter permease [Verrucomicrobiota bacterium]
MSAIFVIFLVPLGLRTFVTQGAELLLERSQQTPLIIGSKASGLELVLDSLYFRRDVVEAIPYRELDEATRQNLGNVVPLHTRFFASKNPIVGTNLDYFAIRELELKKGRDFALLGECVIGAKVAEVRGVGVGDEVISSPEEVFDLAGVYPLKMKVVGVLEETDSADDQAVFVDLKTTWIIEGLAHGHDDISDNVDNASVLSSTDSHTIANASVKEYREIDSGNIASFHFHGDADEFPIHALLVFPENQKNKVLFLGRYLDRKKFLSIYQPEQVIEGLLQTVFALEKVILSGLLILSVSMFIIVILVFFLSFKLRSREFETIKRIGGSDQFVLKMLLFEGSTIILLALLLAVSLVYLVEAYVDDVLYWALLFF